MNTLEAISFNYNQCLNEANEFRTFLASKTILKEREEILPFFRSRKQLSAYIGSYISDIITCNRVGPEFSLGGSFVCDLVVGDWDRQHYAFIEFEDARPKSLFQKRPSKSTPEWSSRLEHGFSQLVDWFYQIEDIKLSSDFQTVFGAEPIDYVGILVVGRAQDLELRENRRLDWRQRFVQVNGKRIYCKTFDQLCEDLLARLKNLHLLAKTP